jgi:hypothetical protein
LFLFVLFVCVLVDWYRALLRSSHEQQADKTLCGHRARGNQPLAKACIRKLSLGMSRGPKKHLPKRQHRVVELLVHCKLAPKFAKDLNSHSHVTEQHLHAHTKHSSQALPGFMEIKSGSASTHSCGLRIVQVVGAT